MDARVLLRKLPVWGIFMVLVLGAMPLTAQVSAPQLWKARALEAAENLQGLQRKLDTFREQWNSEKASETKCEAMLESAFALHFTHESIAHKILKNGKHAFKIILNGGDQGIFDLTYVYDSVTWSLTSVEVLSLPRAWEFLHPTGEARKMGAVLLFVKDKDDAIPRCTFGFSLDAPFFAHVLRSER